MSDSPSDSGAFSKSFTAADLELWREALTHLRFLSDDVWNGLKLFLSLNAVVSGLMVFGLVKRIHNSHLDFLPCCLAVIGIVLTAIARYILKRHRIYYLQMLLKKSLLEDQLGFYQKKFSGTETDLAFPWRLTPDVVAELKANPEAWIQKSIRGKGTIARWQFFLYDALLTIYSLVAAWTLFVALGARFIELPLPS